MDRNGRVRQSIPAPATLIATLGTEAQVVTLTLDWLLEQNEAVDKVIVVHTSPPYGQINDALERVRAEFRSSSYPTSLGPTTVQLAAQDGPLADVDSTEGAEAVFTAMYRAVRAEKLAGPRYGDR